MYLSFKVHSTEKDVSIIFSTDIQKWRETKSITFKFNLKKVSDKILTMILFSLFFLVFDIPSTSVTNLNKFVILNHAII